MLQGGVTTGKKKLYVIFVLIIFFESANLIKKRGEKKGDKKNKQNSNDPIQVKKLYLNNFEVQ